MWSIRPRGANAETLRARGVVLVGRDEGETAEGGAWRGRMTQNPPPPLVPCSWGIRQREASACLGWRTREPLTRSLLFALRVGWSALLEGRVWRGADVTSLAANLSRAGDSAGVELVDTLTASALQREALAHAADVVVMAAAVADYRPADALAAKRPKDTTWTLSSSSRRSTCSRAGRAEARRPDPRRLRRRERPWRAHGSLRARARPLRPQRRLSVGHRLRRTRERGDVLAASESGRLRKHRRRVRRSSTRWRSHHQSRPARPSGPNGLINTIADNLGRLSRTCASSSSASSPRGTRSSRTSGGRETMLAQGACALAPLPFPVTWTVPVGRHWCHPMQRQNVSGGAPCSPSPRSR